MTCPPKQHFKQIKTNKHQYRKADFWWTIQKNATEIYQYRFRLEDNIFRSLWCCRFCFKNLTMQVQLFIFSYLHDNSMLQAPGSIPNVSISQSSPKSFILVLWADVPCCMFGGTSDNNKKNDQSLLARAKARIAPSNLEECHQHSAPPSETSTMNAFKRQLGT